MKFSLSSHPMDRRLFIKSAAVGSAAVAALPVLGLDSPSASAKKIPVGLQLYSLREECKKDLAGMLQAVGKIGYKGVEFAGYHGHPANEIRKMLDENGLVTCGSHTPFNTMTEGELSATIEFNKIIGNHFLIVPSITAKTTAEWVEKARFFNELADKLQQQGMFAGYHAHAHDFRKYDAKSAWDIFATNTRPEVILQLDTSNCRDSGADPVEVLKKYPGRAKSIHIKPNGAGPEAVIGEDKIDWSQIFRFCEGPGHTDWYVVEHESSKHPLDTVRRTFEALKKMGKV